ncbi:MAG TPA: cytochrome d ubiquinol oxidase subunit II [Micropepsaceae bacterium]|nr:cytochrome d ubiquinol oxidase subunit II [Micropepsaceae bacterium]
MQTALPVFFGLAMAFSVLMYVITDGFDLGIGILFLVAPAESDRDLMMESMRRSGMAMKPGWYLAARF